jgi:mono/diheme cytochrome c family protein
MRRLCLVRGPVTAVIVFSALVWLALIPAEARRQAPAATANSSQKSPERAFLDTYCVGCHNARLKSGDLQLDSFDVDRVLEHAETGEKIILRLRAGMMPPAGARRPDAKALSTFITSLESTLDSAEPKPPSPGLHRLNRTEYANVIRDLLGLEVDTTTLLPPDDSTNGFDNMSNALTMSPALMEAYLSAAGKISRLALGTATGTAQAVYTVPEGESQAHHVEGLPFGTRGGMLIKHEFPVDGEYVFRLYPIVRGNMDNRNIAFGDVTGEKLEVSLDGERIKLFDWDTELSRGFVIRTGVETPRVRVKAGLHTVGVTFIATNLAPDIDDLDLPFENTTIDTVNVPGISFLPHLGRVRIDGPFNAAAGQDSSSRQKLFVCRPSGPNDTACVQKILSSLVSRAYRRPSRPADIQALMPFYQEGAKQRGVDAGIEMALRRALVDPEFIYRKEIEPAGRSGATSYRISDLELASRLSFFLWSTIPDEELLSVATSGRLRDPLVLERQVRRMLADPRASALVVNFSGQWLNTRALNQHDAVISFFPDFDQNLRRSFIREIELFVESVVREDRSVIDLLTANYTFVDERLAKHYGIPNVYGSRFRRVELGPEQDMRRGLLGKGGLLTATSQPTRTSPVIRGQWFLVTLLGVTPPAPPANVPPIPAKEENAAGNVRELPMRQKMEQHRANPVCASCHKIMDPIGFALENFDAVGAWRTEDEGIAIDPSGVLVDGTPLTGPASLRDAMVRYSDQYIRVVTEKLLTYALGRGTTSADMPVVRGIVRGAAGSRYRFSDLVLGIVKSVPFQMNTKETTTALASNH